MNGYFESILHKPYLVTRYAVGAIWSYYLVSTMLKVQNSFFDPNSNTTYLSHLARA